MEVNEKIKKLTWTEKYRPRFLNELILKRTQRTYLLSWWRCWKIWWILRNTWAEREQSQWYNWTDTEQGKKWAETHINEWRSFFKKQFNEWIGKVRSKCEKAGSYCYPPKAQQDLFEAATKTRYTTNLKQNGKEKIRKWLKDTWNEFLNEEQSEGISVPPLPPYNPLLLVGPPGNGKSSAAIALSGEFGVPLTELNASDDRSKKSVRKKVGRITRSSTLSERNNPEKPSRIILFDEVDGMAGRKDRGGFGELLNQLEETRLPIIMTANDQDDRKVRKLIGKYYNTTIFFNRPKSYQVEHLIDMISKREGIEVSNEVKEKLKDVQDLRTVVQALESYAHSGRIPQLKKDKMRGFKSSLKKNFAFKKESLEATIVHNQERMRSVQGKDIGDFIMWSWENASKLVKKENLSSFYEELAYADYINRLGRRRRIWRVAYSASSDLAYAMAKWGEEKSNIWAIRKLKLRFPSSYKSYSREKKFKKSREGEGILWQIVNALAQREHVSSKKARQELNLLKTIGKNAPKEAGGILAGLYLGREVVIHFSDEYNLSKKEVEKGYEQALQVQAISKTEKRTEKKKGEKREKEEKRKPKREAKERKKINESKRGEEEKREKEEKKEKRLDEFL